MVVYIALPTRHATSYRTYYGAPFRVYEVVTKTATVRNEDGSECILAGRLQVKAAKRLFSPDDFRDPSPREFANLNDWVLYHGLLNNPNPRSVVTREKAMELLSRRDELDF